VAGFFYPLATNYEQPEVRTNYAFNLLYGRMGELEGFALGSVNAIEADASGFVLGVFVNRAGGRASGLHLAGFVNSSGALDQGVALALLANHASGVVRGGQASLALNFGREVQGAQLAFGVNVAAGGVEGAQVAGAANVGRDFQGTQVALLANVARHLDGAQVGLVNVAGRVRGAQIGLVNIAEDVDGVPFGLVNVTRSGGVHVLAWGGYTSHANVGIKFATRYTYSMLTLGYQRDDDVNAFGPGFVVGVRVPVAPDLGVAFDLGGDYLFGARLCCYETATEERIAHTQDKNHYRLRILPTWQVRPRIALFAGGGVSVNVPFALYSGLDGYDQTVRLEPDFAAGVEF
jgi:hypothetical protein